MGAPADTSSLRVGVVGTGPWAHLVHAPMFAVHPRTTLAAVWGRRLDAAGSGGLSPAVPETGDR